MFRLPIIVSVSPDGERLAIVGDTSQVFLYNITRSGEYERTQTLNTSKDAGFSVAWDQSSTKFAVGCQDGVVCVWDIRRTKKLAQLPSQQSGGRGAVRSVKFSHTGSIDLLAFTEVLPLIPALLTVLAYLVPECGRCTDF